MALLRYVLEGLMDRNEATYREWMAEREAEGLEDGEWSDLLKPVEVKLAGDAGMDGSAWLGLMALCLVGLLCFAVGTVVGVWLLG